MFKITINKKEYEATAAQTILSVVRKYEIDDIPTLCHDERLKPFGSCFLCTVQIEGMNRLVPACSTPVAPGMVITTRNAQIESTRKTALELLLSDHYADCIAPCKNTCPAGVDIQGYISLIAREKYTEAVQLIKQRNPLPLVCGRVCVKDCELACRRNEFDEPASINFLKRFAADKDMAAMWTPDPLPSIGKTVAIVGSGPSGLSCAYYLTLEGYTVTMFEELPELGGMLRYGIPEYRLPKATLDKEIKWITDLGVEVRKNCKIGTDISMDEIVDDFDSVYMAIGAQKAKKLWLDKEDTTEGVLKGVDFLKDLQLKGFPKMTGTVVVVGGGNTAIDAARTAVRCGADSVKIVYRRSIKEMPAHPVEIHAAQEEGVEILFLCNPEKIIDTDGVLTGVECLKMRLVAPSDGGRPRPVPIEGSEFIVECKYLISAISQDVDCTGIKDYTALKLGRNDVILADEDTLQTSVPKIFAGGDAMTGPMTAISGIAHGRKVATSIMEFLAGKEISKKFDFISTKDSFGEVSAADIGQIKLKPRNVMPELTAAARINTFDEVDTGFTYEQAMNECDRCLECGCSEYDDCVLRKYCTEYKVDITPLLGEVNKYEVDKRHHFITMDANKCINCGRCVRTCSEVLNISALGFVHRGFKTVVKSALEKSLAESNCISCGNCIDTCPTGAIYDNLPIPSAGTLQKTIKLSICNFCSVGCNLEYKVMHGGAFYVSNSSEDIQKSHNLGYLCPMGKLGHRYLLDADILTTSYVAKGDTLESCPPEVALSVAEIKIKEIIAAHGADSVAVFASPLMSNEELYILQKFARVGLKNNNIASITDLFSVNDTNVLAGLYNSTASTITAEGMNNADVIVVMSSDIPLVMELKIKTACREGAKLVVISSVASRLSEMADIWLHNQRGTTTLVLNQLMQTLLDDKVYNDAAHTIDGYSAFSDMLAMSVDNLASADICPHSFAAFTALLAKKDADVCFVHHLDSTLDKSCYDIQAAANFLLMTNRLEKCNNGILILRDYANSVGLQDMGVTPHHLPGMVAVGDTVGIDAMSKFCGNLRDVFVPVDLKEKLAKGDIKAALIFGEDPFSDPALTKYFADVDFILVQDSFMTLTAQRADIILAAPAYFEQAASYTNCEGLVQFADYVKYPQEKENWRLLAEFAHKFSFNFNWHEYADLFAEIKECNKHYQDLPVAKYRQLPSVVKKQYLLYNACSHAPNPQRASYLSSVNFFRKNIKSKI